jgi:hypothetical protein
VSIPRSTFASTTPPLPRSRLGEVGNFQGATPDGSRVFFTDNNHELFEYELESEQTTDLAPLANGNVVGSGDDGHYVYLLFDGTDLEVWHDGTITPIAAGIGGIQTLDTWDVSPSGRYVVFQSSQPLTAYDNAEHQEVYRYDAQTAVLDCVSCDPNGAPAGGDAALHSFHVFFTVISSRALTRWSHPIRTAMVAAPSSTPHITTVLARTFTSGRMASRA